MPIRTLLFVFSIFLFGIGSESLAQVRCDMRGCSSTCPVGFRCVGLKAQGHEVSKLKLVDCEKKDCNLRMEETLMRDFNCKVTSPRQNPRISFYGFSTSCEVSRISDHESCSKGTKAIRVDKDFKICIDKHQSPKMPDTRVGVSGP